MGRTTPICMAAVALVLGTIGCVSTSIPSTSPDAVSTIVAATLGAITPAATATAVSPTTSAPPPTPSSSSVPPTLPPVAPPVQVPDATRITFLNGATIGVVSAPLPAGQTQTYVLQAFQGQPMLGNVDSLNQDVTLSIKTQGGTSMLNAASRQPSWEGTLPQTEDYYLTVHAGATTENFTLSITIPSRIKFPEGADSAKLNG